MGLSQCHYIRDTSLSLREPSMVSSQLPESSLPQVLQRNSGKTYPKQNKIISFLDCPQQLNTEFNLLK